MGAAYSNYMDSRSYLHAAEAGELEIVHATLCQHPGLYLLRASTHSGRFDTAWHLAAQRGHLCVLKAIVDQVGPGRRGP